MRRALGMIAIAIGLLIGAPSGANGAGLPTFLETSGRLNANGTEDLIFNTGSTYKAREGSDARELWWGRPVLSPITRAQLRGDSRLEPIQWKAYRQTTRDCSTSSTSETWQVRVTIRVLAPGTGDIGWERSRIKTDSCTPTTYDRQLEPVSARPMDDADGDGKGDMFVELKGEGGPYGGPITFSAGGAIMAGLDGHLVASPHVECADCAPQMVSVPDLDGDGRADVVAIVSALSGGTPTGTTTVTAMKTSGSTIWSVQLAADDASFIGSYVFASAGRKDLLLRLADGTDTHYVALRGSNGSTLWDRAHALVLGDVSGDAISDILDWTTETTTYDHQTARHLIALKSPSMSQLWSTDVVDPAFNSSDEWIERPFQARRFSADLVKDVLLRGQAFDETGDEQWGRWTALNGKTGAVMWRSQFPHPETENPITDQFLDGDLNGDHGDDISRQWIAQNNGACTFGIRFLSGADRHELWRQAWSIDAPDCWGTVYGVADVDGDGRDEPILELGWRTADNQQHKLYKALDPKGSLWTF